MFLEDLKKIKDNELLTRFSQVVQKEREAIAAVVFYLSEIGRRKLYLEEAYSSLFSFVTQKFHYSEGAAYRRIQASKVSQLYPEVLGLLSTGKVSLMTLSLIEPHLTKENAERWIEKIVGKSKREVEFMLSELSLKKESHRDVIRRLPVTTVIPSAPAFAGAGSGEESRRKDPSPPPRLALAQDDKFDKERPEKLPVPLKVHGSFSGLLSPSSEPESAQNFSFTGGSGGGEGSSAIVAEPARKAGSGMGLLPKEEVRKIKVEFVAKEEMAKKIERAKEVLRHKFPEGKFEDIFDQALEDLLEKRDPQRKIERMNKKSEKVSEGLTQKSVILTQSEAKGKDLSVGNDKILRGDKGKPMTRYIPEQVKRVVFGRDQGQCSYKNSDGRRCEERNFIQIDHVQPFALGGESTEENLRILCAQHNQWRAEKTFWKWG